MRPIPSFRGLLTRILAFTVLLALVTVFGYARLYRRIVVPIRNEFMVRMIRQPVDRPRELADCAAHPATWVWDQGNPVYAYHAVTGVSRNPDAPALRRDLVEDGMETHIDFEGTGEQPTTVGVWRTGLSGECGIMQLRYSASQAVEARVQRIFLAVGFSSVPFAGIAVFLAILRPMLTALHRLRMTASGVGREGFQHLDPHRRDEIGEVGRVLAAAHHQILADKAEIAQAQAALERFMADIAHDVRTPLTSLQLTLGALHGHPDKEVREALSRAHADVVYLASLTQNLRLASQLAGDGAPLSPPQTFDLDQIVNRVTERQRVFAVHSGIQLEWLSPGRPVWVKGDPTHTEQAVSNLVENAITYGKKLGQVIVALRHEEEEFELLVEDDGPGVSPEVLPRLSERHFRADTSRSRQKPGSGLGLSITRQVCERAGWALEIALAKPTGLSIVVRGATVAAPEPGAPSVT